MSERKAAHLLAHQIYLQSVLNLFMSIHRLVITFFVLILSAHCQDVLLLQARQGSDMEIDRINTVTTLLGLKPDMTYPDVLNLTMKHIRGKQPRIQAILASADVLSSLEDKLQNRLLLLSQDNHLPVLIFGINPRTNPEFLHRWSGQILSDCRSNPDMARSAAIIQISKNPSNGSLAGLEIPSLVKPVCALSQGGKNIAEAIATASDNSHENLVLARIGNIFFAPRLEFIKRSSGVVSSSITEVFSSVAPFVIFLRDVAGEYAWHLDGHYANFTIDDPWLIQPYGNLDYVTLLAAMKKHKFHTTIAFVPWNYDRSKPDIRDLFRENPKYYSICIHGNDHTHREFGDYSLSPLPKQTDDIKQAVARMEKFHSLTGVNYDRLMVFPHGVAPEATFEQLNRYGFLGTANSLNAPLDDQSQENPLDHLRPFTNKYQGLLSIFRYSAETPISDTDLAVQAYLGNPILVYAHQKAFRGGSKFIADVVDRINKTVPDVRWVSLGDMARHLYLQRKRDDGRGFDITMLSNEATITNSTATPSKYYIGLPVPPSDIVDVRIDGKSVSPQKRSGFPLLQLEIRGGQSRTLVIKRIGEYELSDVIAGRSGERALVLRTISDLRDLYLSRVGIGRAVIQWYYNSRGDSVELFIEQKWKYFLGLLGVVICGLFIRFRMQIAK